MFFFFCLKISCNISSCCWPDCQLKNIKSCSHSWRFAKYLLHNNSVTRLGHFLKLLVTNYIWKVAQMFGDFWVFWKHHFLSKNFIVYFLGNLRKNLATFLIHYLVTLHNNNDSFKKIASFCCCEKTAARISTSCKSRYTKLLR